MDLSPKEISKAEWKEIYALPDVREAWGIQEEDDQPPIYGVKFDFTSGSPGYCGDLFILQGDALDSETAPVRIIRDDRDNGKLMIL